jgi:hypothetical protein
MLGFGSLEAPIINRFLNFFSSVFESLLKQNYVVFLANFFLKNFSNAAQKQCAIINPICSFVNVPNPSLAQANKQNTFTPTSKTNQMKLSRPNDLLTHMALWQTLQRKQSHRVYVRVNCQPYKRPD